MWEALCLTGAGFRKGLIFCTSNSLKCSLLNIGGEIHFTTCFKETVENAKIFNVEKFLNQMSTLKCLMNSPSASIFFFNPC